MAKLNMYAVKDTASDSFDRPIFLPSNGVAIRTFTSEVNRPAQDNPYYQYPNDFILYYLGTYDTDTATFETTLPQQLARGADLKTATDCVNC